MSPEISPVDFVEVVKDKTRISYVSVASRTGFATLSGLVEYRLFHPKAGPNSNDQFDMYVINWSELLFSCFNVPIQFDKEVRQYADVILMRVADGSPATITDKGMEWLPGSEEAEIPPKNLFTIENTSGSQIYLNRRDLMEQLSQREKRILDTLAMYGNQVPLEMVRDFLWFGETKNT